MLRNEYKQAKTEYELSTLTICIYNVHVKCICKCTLLPVYGFFHMFFTFFSYLYNKILILE